MDSESDAGESNTPLGIAGAANSVPNNVRPDKSLQRYEFVCKKLMDWRNDNKLSSFSEGVLLAYPRKISSDLKPSVQYHAIPLTSRMGYRFGNIFF